MCFSKYETTTGAARDGTGTGTDDGDAPESSYAMVKFTPDCDCEGTGACATGAPAVAITSRSPAAVAGRQPTSPTRSGKRAPSRRPPERAPHPSPSRVKTKRAARRGEHPGRLTADDRLARASSCGASRRRLPESARKLDIPRRNLGALRAAKNFLKRLALDCSCALQAGEIIHRLKR